MYSTQQPREAHPLIGWVNTQCEKGNNPRWQTSYLSSLLPLFISLPVFLSFCCSVWHCLFFHSCVIDSQEPLSVIYSTALNPGRCHCLHLYVRTCVCPSLRSDKLNWAVHFGFRADNSWTLVIFLENTGDREKFRATSVSVHEFSQQWKLERRHTSTLAEYCTRIKSKVGLCHCSNELHFFGLWHSLDHLPYHRFKSNKSNTVNTLSKAAKTMWDRDKKRDVNWFIWRGQSHGDDNSMHIKWTSCQLFITLTYATMTNIDQA